MVRLDNARIVVLEEEFLIALDIQRILGEAGAAVIDLVHSIDQLDEHIQANPPYDAAILEVRAQGVSTFAAAKRLQLAGVPLVFATAHDTYRKGVPAFPLSPVVLKPFESTALVVAVITAISNHGAGRLIGSGE